MWKYCTYIHSVSLNNKDYLYNYLNGSLICINLLDVHYQAILKKQIKIDVWRDKYPEFFEILKNELFVYNSMNNEVDLIRYRNRKDVFVEKNFRLTIIPTLECNYNCWYCYEDHPKGRINTHTKKRIGKFINKGINTREISSLELDWFGGEPLMYFYEIVFPLALKLKSISTSNNIPFKNQITTNGYYLKDINPKDLLEIELFNYQITLDGNKELHNKVKKHNKKVETFDITIKNIVSLCNHDPRFKVNIRINYTKATLKYIKELAKLFPSNIRKQLKFTFQEVWQESYKHTEEIYDQVNEISNYFINNGYNSSVVSFQIGNGFCCYADRWNQAVVLPSNYIFKCTARDFTDISKADGYLNKEGKIEWNNDKMIRRFNRATFENEECLRCKYLPLCLGMCSQKMIEKEYINKKTSHCNLNDMKKSVNDFVINYIENIEQYNLFNYENS